MLKKFIAIRNVGRFRSSAGTPNPQLAKSVFVLGPNGHGKTTLCDVLRSLQTGDAAYLTGRKTLGAADPPGVEILLEDHSVARFDGAAWNAPLAHISIFDGAFVAANVHSGDTVDTDQRRNLYRVIIGQEGVALAEREAALGALTRSMTGEITNVARVIQQHVPQGMTLAQFMALPADPDIAARIAAQEQTVAAIREAQQIAGKGGLTELPVAAAPDLAPVLRSTVEGLAVDAEARIAEHLRHHPIESGQEWLARGTTPASDSCPYCGQDIRGLDLVGLFRAVFSDGFRAIRRDVAAAKAALDRQFGAAASANLQRLVEANRGAVAFWSRHCPIDGAPLEPEPGTTAAMEQLRSAALVALDAKDAAPLEAVPVGEAFAAAATDWLAIAGQLAEANARIREANALIAAQKTATAAANLLLAERELRGLVAVRTRHEAAVAIACDEHTQLNADRQAAETEKTGVRAALEAHTNTVVRPYETRINELLGTFNAGFRIAETRHTYAGGIATSSYQLVINQTAIDIGDRTTPLGTPSFKNTLSAGDRSTLALAFFFAHLERDARRANMIVAFDDPFQSQDAFRRRQTVYEIRRCAMECAQTLVLSHDAAFLKLIWDKTPAAERVGLQIFDARAAGSKLIQHDLEGATQGRVAIEIDHLQGFVTLGTGQPVDIIKKLRVVLEAYCKSTFQSSFLATDWLGDIVRKIREGSVAHPAHELYTELDEINGYTAEYHHADGSDVDSAPPIDVRELTGFARRTLVVVNALQA